MQQLPLVTSIPPLDPILPQFFEKADDPVRIKVLELASDSRLVARLVSSDLADLLLGKDLEDGDNNKEERMKQAQKEKDEAVFRPLADVMQEFHQEWQKAFLDYHDVDHECDKDRRLWRELCIELGPLCCLKDSKSPLACKLACHCHGEDQEEEEDDSDDFPAHLYLGGDVTIKEKVDDVLLHIQQQMQLDEACGNHDSKNLLPWMSELFVLQACGSTPIGGTGKLGFAGCKVDSMSADGCDLSIFTRVCHEESIRFELDERESSEVAAHVYVFNGGSLVRMDIGCSHHDWDHCGEKKCMCKWCSTFAQRHAKRALEEDEGGCGDDGETERKKMKQSD